MKSKVSQAVHRFVDARRGLASALIGVAVCATCLATARADPPSMADVERAVLAADAGSGSLEENWAPVVRLLEGVNEKTPDPVLRLIKGHACLAVNENNESVCLFLSAQAPEARKRWLRWSEAFAGRRSSVPIADYFHGDALGRLERWDDAVARFTAAIEKAPKKQHALAFNARGVVYASQHDFRTARVDFHSALASSGGRLADAYANIGALRIDTKEAAEAAGKAFDRVIGGSERSPQGGALSPNYTLALHGRACVRLVLGQVQLAQDDFRAAQKYGRCALPLLQRNQLRIVAYWRGMTEGELLAAIGSGDEAGTTLDSSMQSVKNAWDNFESGAGHIGGQFKYNRFHERFSGLTPGQQQQFFKQNIAPKLQSNSRVATSFQQALGNVRNTNKPGGFATRGGDIAMGVGGVGAIASAAGNPPLAAAFGVGGGAVKAKTSEWQNHNFNGANRLVELQQSTLGRQAGGLDMNLANIAWESGDWPFDAYYGLMFQTVADDRPDRHATVQR
ncbi:MAG: tetratricopeptide repeat protein [bacterium]